MEMTVHDEKKFVEIWLTRDEARDMELKKRLHFVCQYYKRLKYFVSIYESGDSNLLENMAALLRHNIEIQARVLK